MKLTPEELAALSPEEAEALQGDDAADALNTMGDTVLTAESVDLEAIQAASSEEGEGAEEGTDGGNVSTPEATTEQAAAALEELAPAAEAAPAPALPTFEVPATDFKAQRETLRAEKRDLAKQWSDGTLSDEDYHAKVDSVDDKMATLLTEQTRADTLREVNEQNTRRAAEAAEAAELQALQTLAKASKAAGQIDYGADAAAASQFDMLFSATKADPANAKLTPAALADKAHKAVLALRGISTAAPAPAPAPKPAAAPAAPRNVPPSIGGLPNAAASVVQDDMLAQFNKLSGTDAEEFQARLPANQVERLLRTTDNLGLH
jgi:hypothetical protein